MRIDEHVILGEHTWFGTGGAARFFCEPQQDEEMQEALAFARQHGLAVHVLGDGANVLISDAGGAAELVTAPVAGRIVARTPGAIADAVHAILAAPPLSGDVAASLGGRFDWDRNGRELADHLRRCAGR